MSDWFVEVPFETDAQTLADDAVDRLKLRWPGWEPDDGDMEVIQIETLAPMAANAAETAARMPSAAFRNYGVTLLGVPYTSGAYASTTVTFQMIDAGGYTIPEGTEVQIDAYAFATTEEAVVAPGGSIAASVPVSALETGADKNGIDTATASLITALAAVDSVTVDGPVAGGADAEVDSEYQERLSRELTLQGTTLVTETDFEIMGLSEPGVGRVVAQHDGARNVLITAIDPDGEPLTTTVKDSLTARYEAYRLVNTVFTIADATYATISVTYAVKALTNVDPDDLLARIDAMLETKLTPLEWGAPKFFGEGTPTVWEPDPRIRVYKIVDLIGDVNGVDYVVSLTLAGTSGSPIVPEANGDLIIPGAVGLPRPGTMTGSVV